LLEIDPFTQVSKTKRVSICAATLFDMSGSRHGHG
jgi:hypothetical protein